MINKKNMLIGGEFIDSDRRIEVCNPARPSEIVGSIVRGTAADMGRAVAAAKAAQPAWALKSHVQRADAIASALDKTLDGLTERATLYVRENGRTLTEANTELSDVVPRARHTLGLAAEMDGAREMPSPNGHTTIRTLPFGVVVGISPWNAPVSLACMQIIPALLTGNAVVVKVPESCPLALSETVELMASALPPGLLNIVSGLPAEIGDALTGHPDVGKIAFVGSVPSARHIIRSAAQTIKSVTSELGGNDAAILLPDVDLGEETMRRMAGIVFRLAGQVCMAIKRIYVPETIHDQFLAAFTAAVDRIVVGDGLRPSVMMGALHTQAARVRTADIVADAKQRGATVTQLGQIEDEASFAEGYFWRPTIVTHVPDDARLVAEEQFCPVIPVLSYRDPEDALRRANDTIFGLGGSVWGQDIEAAKAVAARLEAGTVFINTHGTNSVNRRAPYGGMKQSGMGRRAGPEGLREYTQLQTLTTFEP